MWSHGEHEGNANHPSKLTAGPGGPVLPETPTSPGSPWKKNPAHTRKISISALYSHLTGGFCFQFKYNSPFHRSQVPAVGNPADIDFCAGSVKVIPVLDAETLFFRASCGFSSWKYKRKHTLPEGLTQFPLKSKHLNSPELLFIYLFPLLDVKQVTKINKQTKKVVFLLVFQVVQRIQQCLGALEVPVREAKPIY